MVSTSIVIESSSSLRLRPTGILYKKALPYKSRASFKIRTTTANVKSVLGVLGACMKFGDEITLVCRGLDEKEALAAMVKIVEDGLGE